MKPLKLKSHLILFISAVTLILTFAFVTLFATSFRSYCMRELAAYGEVTSKHANFQICDYLATENYAGLQEYVKEINERPNVEAIVVTNRAGTVLAASNVFDIGTSLTDVTVPHGDGGRGAGTVRIGSGSSLSVTGPIVFRGREYGHSRFYVSTKAMEAQIAQVVRWGILTGIAGWILSVCIAVPGSAVITRPLRKLMGRVGGVGRGEFHILPTQSGVTELVCLAETLNSMSSAIESRERDLLASERNFRSVFEGVRDGIFIASPQGRIVEANPSLADILCYEHRDDLKGLSLFADLFLDYRESRRILGQVREQGAVEDAEVYLKRRDGLVIVATMTCRRVVDEGSATEKLEGTIRDITRQKKTEDELSLHRNNLEKRVRERTIELREARQKLIDAERLALLGQFAGSLSHEIRNPLACVSNSVYLLRHVLVTEDERILSAVTMMEVKMKSITDIIESIVRLSRAEKMERSCIDLSSALEGALQELTMPPSVSLVWKRRNGRIAVNGDDKQIRMAARNVIKNAMQAMVKGGVLTIEVESLSENGEDKVEARFSDTGEGIENGKESRIFDPLFTTKTYGLGYGLCIVKMIAEQHDGSVRAYSNEHGGTTLAIRLPRCDCCREGR